MISSEPEPTPPTSPAPRTVARGVTTHVAPRRDALVLTGERTLPGIPDERYWFARHVVAYEYAATLVARHAPTSPAPQHPGPTVLDAGCGEGYGLAMLAEAGAGRVVGVDLDATVVAHVEATYVVTDPRIEVAAAELMTLPLADDAVDLTVSFQVIEHLHDIPGYLASLRRVTAPDGAVLIATPNRLTFTPDSEVPVNPFHTREFTAAELTDELTRAGFVVEEVLGLHHGERLAAVEAQRGTALPELLGATAPEHWDADLRELVHATEPDGFMLRTDDLDASLDLLAVCRIAPGP